MEFRDMRALVKIAEHGTLSGAAQHLNLTQPALSALVRRLESELDVRLVTRHSRGVSFTAEGRYLLEKAYTILGDVAETKSTLREIAEEPVGSVHLGLPASIAGGIIPELLPAIERRYGRIQLHIIEAMSGYLVELLQLGKLDLAVLFDIQHMPGLRSEPILIEEIELVVNRRHDLAHLQSTTLGAVAEHGLVLPSPAHSIRQMVERAAAAEGVQLTVKADIDSMAGLVGLVHKGYATMLPSYLLRNEARAGQIRTIRIQQPKLGWALHLATRIDINRPRAAMVVGRMLAELCELQVRSGAWPGKPHPRRPSPVTDH